MIAPEIKAMFGNHQLCWMATADASGVPNVAPMRQVWWIDERSLVIGDMFMKATAANVQSTGRMCLAAYDPATERSWKLTGTAAYETEGARYDLAQTGLQKKSPGKRFKGVVVFQIHAVYDQVPGPKAGSLVVEL
ncbi:MAG: pyridoxamine 5'-phosphate oxidase family protein [Pirellulales bacterium]|nr:pyridoxamine 5'-phosphate oxidase family protein [Pirellulales bacterium]